MPRIWRPGRRSHTLASCPGPLFVHWVTWKVSEISPGSPRSGFWGVAVLEGSGWCQEEWGQDWGSWCTSHCLFWALGKPALCSPHPWICASSGPVCTVLPTATLPLCTAAIPEAGGAASPEEPGAGKGHTDVGCACGHSALRSGH